MHANGPIERLRLALHVFGVVAGGTYAVVFDLLSEASSAAALILFAHAHTLVDHAFLIAVGGLRGARTTCACARLSAAEEAAARGELRLRLQKVEERDQAVWVFAAAVLFTSPSTHSTR